MITVTAKDFNANGLSLIEEMNRTKVPIAVTDCGKRVAEMYPVKEVEAAKPFIGSMKGTVRYYSDPFAPVLDEYEWDAMK